jgi:integrase/recombinase XerD
MQKSKEQHKRGQFTYTKKEINRLLAAADTIRDRLIITLLIYGGLRREEVVSIQRGDVDRSRKRVRIHGKGNKYRLIPLRDDTIQLIDFHLKILPRKFKRSPWLFPATNKKDAHLCAHRVNIILQRTGKAAGLKNPNPKLKNVNPHSLRHTFARILKKKKVEIAAIKEVMGHKDIRTTMESYGLPSIKEVHKTVLNAIT